MKLYLLTASQLESLLQVLGALVIDYTTNEDGKLDPKLDPFLSSVLQWKQLPSLSEAVKAAKSGNNKVEAYYNVGVELRDQLKSFQANREYKRDELELLAAIATYLRTDSEPALRKIKSNARFFVNPELVAYFASEIEAVDTRKLKNIVKKIVGRDSLALTADEAKLLKDTDPKSFEEYRNLRTEHTKSFKDSLMSYIRLSGKSKVDYESARIKMVNLGFSHSMVPGFQGLIDDKGTLYTKEGKELGACPNVSTYSRIEMNPNPSPDNAWIAKAYKHFGSEYSTIYTVEHARTHSAAKFENLRDLMVNMEKIRNKWFQKVKKFDPEDPVCVASVVLEILFEFAARVGSAPGRGVSTLLCKQASITTTGINLAYLGKASVPTKHMLKSIDPYQKYVIKALTVLMEGKKPSDRIFTYQQGNRAILVGPSLVNRVFHQMGASANVTVHKIRTYRATKLFIALVEKYKANRRPPKDPKAAIKEWMDLCAQVGKLLNHKTGVGTSKEKITGLTAAKSYIDLSLQISLWDDWGLRPPKQLEKWLEDDKD